MSVEVYVLNQISVSSVSILTVYVLGGQVSVPGRTRILLLTTKLRPALGPNHPPVY
jgi:hypothetical protein